MIQAVDDDGSDDRVDAAVFVVPNLAAPVVDPEKLVDRILSDLPPHGAVAFSQPVVLGSIALSAASGAAES